MLLLSPPTLLEGFYNNTALPNGGNGSFRRLMCFSQGIKNPQTA